MGKPRILAGLHRWIALAFAPLLLIQASTGAVLLFRDELTGLAMPVRSDASADPASLSALAQAAERAQPGYRTTRLFFPAAQGSAALAQLEGADGIVHYAALDPSDATVISAGAVWRFPLEAALQVHYRLTAGSVGLAVVALNGLALAALAATGLWQWWPGAGRVASELRAPARAPSRLKLRMWHRSLGAVLAVVLLTSATTGVLLSVPDLSFASTPSTRPVALGAREIDRAFALAREVYPGAKPRDVRIAADGSLAVNFFAPRGGKWAVDVVTVPATGQRVTSVLPFERNPALWLIALPIHSGDTLGPAGRWPMLAAALALIVLAVSGPLMWWRRTRKEPKR